MIDQASPQFQEGIRLLKHPVMPLVRIVQFLFLTGSFEKVSEILDELNEPVETETATYENPGEMLRPFLAAMEPLHLLKNPQPTDYLILDENLEQLGDMEALDLWVCQQVLNQELERINSLLCGPCGCTLCCVGPGPEMTQDFFEIPLSQEEITLFDLPRIDSDKSRQHDPYSDKSFLVAGKQFHETPSAVYHWQHGWGLILPKDSSCPNLDTTSGGCTIYPKRPEVCRKPQIFPYALERAGEHDRQEEKARQKAYIRRGKLLAVWDCPYVQLLQEEIAAYAQMCGLETVFKQNKG